MTPLICFFAENILQNNLQVMITLRKKEYILISYQCLDPIWIFWTQKQSKQDKISEIFYSLCISNCDMHIVLCVKGPKWRRDNHPYFLHAPAQHFPQPAFKIFTAIYRKISQPQTRQMITLLWKTLYARPDLFLWPLQMWTTSKTPIIRNLLCTDQNWSFTAPFCHQVCKPANCEKISKKAWSGKVQKCTDTASNFQDHFWTVPEVVLIYEFHCIIITLNPQRHASAKSKLFPKEKSDQVLKCPQPVKSSFPKRYPKQKQMNWIQIQMDNSI